MKLFSKILKTKQFIPMNSKFMHFNKLKFSSSNTKFDGENIQKVNFDLYNVNFEAYTSKISKEVEEFMLKTDQFDRENMLSQPPDFTDEVKEKMMNTQLKFSLPFGWGWTYPLIKYASAFLISTQAYTAIPWMFYIILCGVTVRVIFLPMMIKQMVLINKMSKVTPYIRLLYKCTKQTNLPSRLKAYYFTRAFFKYCKGVKVNPFIFIAYNLFQIPVFFTMILSIRKISSEVDLTGCGILWFKNLNEPDPYMILPLISVTLTYFNLGVSAIFKISK